MELDAELIGYGACVFDVFLPGAMTNDVFLIDPIFHVGPDHVMSLADEQCGSHTTVHASGQCGENTGHAKLIALDVTSAMICDGVNR